MRMHAEAPEIEATEPIASGEMGIRDKDAHIVFDILRSKLWATAPSGRLRLRHKDPLKAAVREYLCNARDAHRENGNPDEPIRVVLPTELSKQIEIQDVGVGLSPVRMDEIFRNFSLRSEPRLTARSTKRCNNIRLEAHR